MILGATKPEQLLENLKALELYHKLTPDVLAKIDEIVGNKPAPWVSAGSWSRSWLLPRSCGRVSVRWMRC